MDSIGARLPVASPSSRAVERECLRCQTLASPTSVRETVFLAQLLYWLRPHPLEAVLSGDVNWHAADRNFPLGRRLVSAGGRRASTER